MAPPSYQLPPTRLFPPTVLASGEVMRWEDNPHPIILFKPLIWLIIVSIIFVVCLAFASLADVCIIGPAIFWLIFGLLPFIMALIAWKYTLYGITDKRVLWQRGFLGKSRESVPFDKIINFGVDYGFIEKIVGCGTITISTAGGVMKITKRRGALGGGIYWHAVRQPDVTEKLLHDIIDAETKRKKAEEYRAMAEAFRGAPASPYQPPPPVPPVQPTYQPPPPVPPAQSICTTCGRPLTYVQQYQRWYCESCRKYA